MHCILLSFELQLAASLLVACLIASCLPVGMAAGIHPGYTGVVNDHIQQEVHDTYGPEAHYITVVCYTRT